MKRPSLVLMVAAAVVYAAGCGSASGPKLYPVTGKVTYNGKPVEGAFVQFYTEGAARAARGTTDAQGVYQLSTFEPGDGAMAGEHIVTITKRKGGGEALSDEEMQKQMEEEMQKQMEEQTQKPAEVGPDDSTIPEAGAPDSVLPAIYADPKQTPLKATVSPDGPREFNFELKDDAAATAPATGG